MSIAPTLALFPPLQARNLNGRTLALPAELAGARNVVIIAFRRWHQPLVDAWFPALAPLLAGLLFALLARLGAQCAPPRW